MRRLIVTMAMATALISAAIAPAPATGVSLPSAHPTAHKVGLPDPITAVDMTPGPQPGETTITWKSSGRNTDFFRIETALTPFSYTDPKVPDKGWNSKVWKAPGNVRSLTLTPDQTAAAGAGLGTGRHLFYRIFAVHQGGSREVSRPYAYLQHATIMGQAPATGAALRVASYNIRLGAIDVGTNHPWADRAPRVAANIAAERPAIVAVQELIPLMWNADYNSIGLGAELSAQHLDSYRLTRDRIYTHGTPIDARILYDSSRVQMVSNCPDDTLSCAIIFPDVNGHPGGASYARFRDLTSGKEFYVISVHLYHGTNEAGDALRGRQAQTVLDGITKINTDHIPVIFAGDFNSCQTSPGHDAPERALLSAGYYDTSAAVQSVNSAYNTVNDFAPHEQPSNYGFGARLDKIMTLGMPGADRFETVRTGAPYPSDHNMIVADLRLP